MKKLYRNKPVQIEAIQFFDNADVIVDISDFVGDIFSIDYSRPDNPILKIQTPEGVQPAFVGDYIVKVKDGEFYPCQQDAFEAFYYEVN